MGQGLSEISPQWDLLIIGGGITGAGILAEASRMGMRALLCEQRDFAWGTSSRSSKLVHGGLRYLRQGSFHLTLQSVRHRERLLREAEGLVSPIPFLMPVGGGPGPGRLSMAMALALYDMMAGKRFHRYLGKEELETVAPGLSFAGLRGGFLFKDAQVDDARLVLRLIMEAQQRGAVALNYTRVGEIIRDRSGKASGALLVDEDTGETRPIRARALINATGVWAEGLQRSPDARLRLRPLRGSHLVFPQWRLPVYCALTLIHPRDRRPLFMFPWEGVLIFGTTDVDHGEDLSQEPRITAQEANYMMECLRYYFPASDIGLRDAVSSWSGVRSVLSSGPKPPSQESREHVVWKSPGMVTVTGGKLTTFRVLAKDALEALAPELGLCKGVELSHPVYDPGPDLSPQDSPLAYHLRRRLWARYGQGARWMLENASRDELEPIAATDTLWAELAYVARFEKVRHLDDLLLRRVRVGILTRRGGIEFLERVRSLCAPILGWDEARFQQEKEAYLRTIERAYSAPEES